jgi:hypothetical protein
MRAAEEIKDGGFNIFSPWTCAFTAQNYMYAMGHDPNRMK